MTSQHSEPADSGCSASIQCPQIVVRDLPEHAKTDITAELLGTIDRFSNTTWESDCHVRLIVKGLPEVGGTYLHLVATARFFRTSGPSPYALVLQRMFQARPEMRGVDDYMPVRIYERVIDILWPGVVAKGANYFRFSNPSFPGAILAWAVGLGTDVEALSLWDVMKWAASLL